MARVSKQHQQTPHEGMDIARLRLHMAIHVVVETQLADGQPAETARTLARLMEGGVSRHEAIHLIGTVVSQELISAVDQQPAGGEGAPDSGYDEQRFVDRLQRLRPSP